ncbi:MAG: hypothetical protein I4O48_15475 [Ralstonia sp.]|uniref:Transmembrane protein n=2 Tax=Ralstonia TaxID=48736 RepID=A0AAD2BTY8_9RALS|nr:MULTISPECIES: hypothetical protein [Ralstonia]MCL6469696.1 hypothetical protein [Ralstonia sp.]CAJ0790298.1 hypothetical protein R77560_01990 [Ralstonia sp. LMG 18095]
MGSLSSACERDFSFVEVLVTLLKAMALIGIGLAVFLVMGVALICFARLITGWADRWMEGRE